MFVSWLRQNNNSVSLPRKTSSRDHYLTTSRTAVVEAALYCCSERRSPTVFFYCDECHEALDGSYILSSFIKQLCGHLLTSRHCPEEVLIEIRKFFGPKQIQPDFEDLKDIFIQLFPYVSDTIYIIDGFDVLDQKHSNSLLGLIRSLFCSSSSSKGSRILLFSRDQVPGYINVATFMPGIRHISTSANVMQDIKAYIETSIADKTMYRKLTDNTVLVEDIKRTLLCDSSGMYDTKHSPMETNSADCLLTCIGFYGCISSWRSSGTHATQMRKYVWL